MKKKYTKPIMKIEIFVPHQYIGACNTSNFYCNKDLDIWILVKIYTSQIIVFNGLETTKTF